MEVHDDDQDRLMDMLLREELGGQRPPQLAERILQRAKQERASWWRPRMTPAWVAALVAAAMVAFVVVPRLLPSKAPQNVAENPKQPPKQAKAPENPPEETEEQEEPELKTPVAPTPAPPVPPVAPKIAEKIIRSEDKERVVELGDFCRVTLAPFTTVENKVEAADSKEQHILLKEGSVACEVDSKKGKFKVEHALGTVFVRGTKFRVNTVKHEGHVRRLTVGVKEGVVFFDAPWGEMELEKGQEGGTLLGLVTSVGKDFIEVRADGEHDARKYSPRWVGGMDGKFDRQMIERLHDYKPGMRVRMIWKFDERDRVLGIEGIDEKPAKREGDGAKREGPRRDEKPDAHKDPHKDADAEKRKKEEIQRREREAAAKREALKREGDAVKRDQPRREEPVKEREKMDGERR
ncbi:MAG TPA: FecR domain-containing protein [Planctomycetota bacterium]|nr:FecR domain-containing protein [Planctomycetota bacterium]